MNDENETGNSKKDYWHGIMHKKIETCGSIYCVCMQCCVILGLEDIVMGAAMPLTPSMHTLSFIQHACYFSHMTI